MRKRAGDFRTYGHTYGATGIGCLAIAVVWLLNSALLHLEDEPLEGSPVVGRAVERK
jgi:hypothetical protein